MNRVKVQCMIQLKISMIMSFSFGMEKESMLFQEKNICLNFNFKPLMNLENLVVLTNLCNFSKNKITLMFSVILSRESVEFLHIYIEPLCRI